MNTFPSPLTPFPFQKAAVIGAGVMGAQIAAHLANAGLEVLLYDVSLEAATGGLQRALKLKPNPFFSADVALRIYPKSLETDLQALETVGWIIEAVVERLDVKQQLFAKIEEFLHPNAIVSTNTSGIPLHQISQNLSPQFKSRFLGTHFFNPPRYLKLLEIIPLPETDKTVVNTIVNFGNIHLGKGIVIAKDTPNFIGNRIGVYAMMRCLKELDNGYSIEEIDFLTGTLIGHPASATFRTADVVGLDTLVNVCKNLHPAIPNDENRDTFLVPDWVDKLVKSGRLGAKTRAGIYQKIGREILSINPQSLEYEAAKPKNIASAEQISGNLEKRVKSLWADEGRGGAFFRATTTDILAYCVARLPEIAEHPTDIDNAIKWGFGWEMGPFEMATLLGLFESPLPPLSRGGNSQPPLSRGGNSQPPLSSGGNSQLPLSGGGNSQPPLSNKPSSGSPLDKGDLGDSKILWKNDEAALIDEGDGVTRYEFRSKANTLGTAVMQGLLDAIDFVEAGDFRGMVIGNWGKNFSVGANLGELAMGLMMEDWDTIDKMVAGFQNAVQRIHYAKKPIVTAAHSRTLGGACEILMASPNPVLSAETYCGLVELGVGLIPAGCGTMRMAAYASENAASEHPSDIQALLRKNFETVAMARVATSAQEAIELNFAPKHAQIVMNDENRLQVAKQQVYFLSEIGYRPPAKRNAIRVLGKSGKAAFDAILYQFTQGKRISAYDAFLAGKLAHILTGGNLTGLSVVPEDYLLDLEREVFLSLLGEEKTKQRIESILTSGKPLRN